MTITCSFTINGMYMSTLHCMGVGVFPAWSGQKFARMNPNATNVVGSGPLPKGRYYIVGRESGGRLTALRSMILSLYGTDRSTWFALYKDDGVIDDETFIKGVKRGAFRIHPIGPMGTSQGCITLSNPSHFNILRSALLATQMMMIPGTSIRAYGTVNVR